MKLPLRVFSLFLALTTSPLILACNSRGSEPAALTASVSKAPVDEESGPVEASADALASPSFFASDKDRSSRDLLTRLAGGRKCGPSGGCTDCMPMSEALRADIDASDQSDDKKQELLKLVSRLPLQEKSCPKKPPGGPIGPGGGCDKCRPVGEVFKNLREDRRDVPAPLTRRNDRVP